MKVSLIIEMEERIKKNPRMVACTLKNLSKVQVAYEKGRLNKKNITTLYLYLEILATEQKSILHFARERKKLKDAVAVEMFNQMKELLEIESFVSKLPSEEIFEWLKIFGMVFNYTGAWRSYCKLDQK